MTKIKVIDVTVRCIEYDNGSPCLPYTEVRKAIPIESLPKTIQSSQLPESILEMVLEFLHEVESLQPTV